MKKAFIYTRVSTLEQAKDGYSIGEQERRLKAYAEAKGLEIIKVYSDPGFSGAKMERPALKEMIKNIAAADVVLVYKLDRLSRSQKDTLHLIEDVFLKSEVDFISLQESFDTSTSFGRAMVGILSVFAQLEREQMLERFAMGKEGRVKSGKFYGGGSKTTLITGYDYQDGNLTVNEYEAACVRLIFELKSKNTPPSKIWDRVQQEFPDVLKSVTTINGITENETYLGKLRWKGKLYEGNHEPIISQELFDLANSKVNKRARARSTQQLLTGFMTCGQCGSPLNASGGFKLQDGTPIRYYICRGRKKYRDRSTYRPNCKLKFIRQDAADKIIIDEIKRLKVGDVKIGKKEVDHSRDTSAIQSEIDALDKQVNKLIELFSLGNIDFDKINKRITELNAKKEKLQTKIKDLGSTKEEESSLEDKIKTISKLTEVDFDNLETAKKRLIVAKLINNITVLDDNFTIDWTF